MLRLEDYKKSRFYKEIREEFQEETVEKLSKQGFSTEDIAKMLEMDLNAVKKILKKKPKK